MRMATRSSLHFLPSPVDHRHLSLPHLRQRRPVTACSGSLPLFHSVATTPIDHQLSLQAHRLCSASSFSGFGVVKASPLNNAGVCYFSGYGTTGWSILRRWEVPWGWWTVVTIMLRCMIVNGVHMFELAYRIILRLRKEDENLDLMAGIMFLDSFFHTVVLLRMIFFGIKQPFTDGMFSYKFNCSISLLHGCLLWGMIGFAMFIIVVIRKARSLKDSTSVEDSKVAWEDKQDGERHIRLKRPVLPVFIPYVGTSIVSTIFMLGMIGILTPILEETVFRGFLMVSLTKWFPTPISVLLTAAVFAMMHKRLSPIHFVFGTIVGFSYAHTRNLVTPIIIHALWNTTVISWLVLIRFNMQLRGYSLELVED